MTPEDRAINIVNINMQESLLHEELEALILNAIKEAIQEERQACCELIQDQFPKAKQPWYAEGYIDALKDSLQAIRKRGEP